MPIVFAALLGFILSYSHLSYSAESDEPVFTLDTIEVTADPLPEQIDRSVNKIELDPLDSAQSLTSVDKEVIDDQQATDVSDALKNDASLSNRGNFGTRNNFASRGFELNDSGNYLRNGLLFFFFDSPAIETIERVEILKGPTSFLYGQGSPGGMINFITKAPEEESFVNGLAQTGSWNYYRATADLNKAANDDHPIGYRINVAAEDSDSFRDDFYRERGLFDFSADFDSFNNTNTLFNFSYQNSTQPQDVGLVAIGDEVVDLPRSTTLTQDWTLTDLTMINTSLDSYTQLNQDWSLHSALYYQYVDRDRILSTLSMSADSEGDFRYSMQHRLDTWNYYNALADFNRTFDFLGFEQKLLLGSNYSIMQHQVNATPITFSETYNIFDPPEFAEPDFGEFEDPIDTVTTDLGLYFQDVIAIHQNWEAILGARFDDYHAHSEDLTDSSAQHTTPHAALVFKPLDFFSTYASYSEGFEFNEPVSDSNATNFGEELEPTLSEQIEIGAKMELFNSRLLLSTALFDILRHNQPITEDIDNSDEVVVVQRGEQHHQGLELGAQGKITDKWTVLSSLMWLDARFSEDNTPDVAGNRPASVPSLSATFWTEYRFNAGGINQFGVNGGVFYEGERYGDDQNSFVLDPYSRIDIGAAYYYPIKNKDLIVRLNFENILDETYYYAYRRTNVTVGQPASVWLSFEIQ